MIAYAPNYREKETDYTIYDVDSDVTGTDTTNGQQMRQVLMCGDFYYSAMGGDGWVFDFLDTPSFKLWLRMTAPKPEIKNEKAIPVFYPKPDLKRKMMACNRFD